MLLYVAEVLSSLIDHEWRPIRIEFLTLQGKPNTHAWGNEVTHATFPLSFPSVDQGHPPRLQSTATLQPHVGRMRTSFKEGESKVHSPVQSGTLLTDYHISRHVVSTFKRLTTCTTHCGLSTFSLNRRGLNYKYHPMTPPVNLMIAVCDKPVRIYNLARGRKPLNFYRS